MADRYARFRRRVCWALGVEPFVATRAEVVDMYAEGLMVGMELAQKLAPREVCLCAAIRTEDGTVLRGHRHDDCIETAIKMRLRPSAERDAQGFITSANRFVDRREGMALQKAAGVASAREYRGEVLFSEDLY